MGTLVVYIVGCLLTYLGIKWLVSSLKDEEHAEQIRRGTFFCVMLWPLIALGLMGFVLGMVLMALHDILPDWLKKRGHYDNHE